MAAMAVAGLERLSERLVGPSKDKQATLLLRLSAHRYIRLRVARYVSGKNLSGGTGNGEGHETEAARGKVSHAADVVGRTKLPVPRVIKPR